MQSCNRLFPKIFACFIVLSNCLLLVKWFYVEKVKKIYLKIKTLNAVLDPLKLKKSQAVFSWGEAFLRE